MTVMLCVCYVLLVLIFLAAVLNGYFISLWWALAFLFSFCLGLVLCGMLGAMDVQVQELKNRVAALETGQNIRHDNAIEEDTAK